MDKIEVKIKRLSDTAIVPTYGSEKAAGLDLYADLGYDEEYIEGSKGKIESYRLRKTLEIPPHTNKMIGCGFAFQPPEGYAGYIYARSGLATKRHLRPGNCVGVADEDYRGEYIVPLFNDGDEAQIIHHGDRIAQLIFMPYEQALLTEVNELDETDRGSGGFGSSGR